MQAQELKAKFDEVYKYKVEPKFLELERKRLKAFKKYNIFKVMCFLSSFAALLFIFLFAAGNKNPIFLVGFAIFLLISVLLSYFKKKTKNNFRLEAKKVLLKPVLSIFGSFYLSKEGFFTLGDIKDFGLFHQSTKKIDDDNIAGEYKGKPIVLSEVKLTHREMKSTGRSSRGRQAHKSAEITDFCGLILMTKFSRKFKGTSVLRKKNTLSDFVDNAYAMGVVQGGEEVISKIKNNQFFKFADMFYRFRTNREIVLNGRISVKTFDYATHKKKKKYLEKVSLEDIAFNNKYEIFSDDQVEARYILNPSFMEKIRDLEKNFITTCEGIIFDENSMYVFLNRYISRSALNSHKDTMLNNRGFIEKKGKDDWNNSLFEVVDLSRNLSGKEDFERAFLELCEIFSFVDFITDSRDRNE